MRAPAGQASAALCHVLDILGEDPGGGSCGGAKAAGCRVVPVSRVRPPAWGVEEGPRVSLSSVNMASVLTPGHWPPSGPRVSGPGSRATWNHVCLQSLPSGLTRAKVRGTPSFPSSRVPSSSPPEFCFSDALLSVTGKAASEVAGSPTVSEKRSHPKASRTLSPLLSQPQWACHQRAIQFSERSFSHVFP